MKPELEEQPPSVCCSHLGTDNHLRHFISVSFFFFSRASASPDGRVKRDVGEHNSVDLSSSRGCDLSIYTKSPPNSKSQEIRNISLDLPAAADMNILIVSMMAKDCKQN